MLVLRYLDLAETSAIKVGKIDFTKTKLAILTWKLFLYRINPAKAPRDNDHYLAVGMGFICPRTSQKTRNWFGQDWIDLFDETRKSWIDSQHCSGHYMYHSQYIAACLSQSHNLPQSACSNRYDVRSLWQLVNVTAAFNLSRSVCHMHAHAQWPFAQLVPHARSV